MKACDNFIAFFIHLLFSVCATVSEPPNAMGITELTPLFISAGLSDIIVISAPVIDNTNTIYYLSDPNGDSIKLNINTTKVTNNYYKDTSRTKNNHNYNHNPIEGKVKTVIGTTKKRKISLNYENYDSNCPALYDDFDEEPNDFKVGPLSEDDHGNWVLSLYYRGNDGDWRELFQVITIHLVESLETYSPKTKLILGQTFEPRFLYPINNLQSCEIIAPRTAFDRFYDRDGLNMDSCGFRIPNVTKDDEGIWTILGVSKLVFKGAVYLKIDDEDL